MALLEKAGPAQLVDGIEKFGATVVFTAPTSYRVMAQQGERIRRTRLRKCVSAGEALTASTRALWKDESIIPVRGQIAWLIPQPELHYGLYYRNVSVLPRRDGIVVQYVGETEAWGYNDDNETASRTEAEAAIATIAGLYRRADRTGS